jgi:hypothetical protein
MKTYADTVENTRKLAETADGKPNPGSYACGRPWKHRNSMSFLEIQT